MPLKKGHTIPPRRASSSWNIPMNSLLKLLEWKNRILKDGVRRRAYKIRCKSDYMDINYARMWIVHKPVTIKDESYKTNTYKGHIIVG
jgi:hypothetical protein